MQFYRVSPSVLDGKWTAARANIVGRQCYRCEEVFRPTDIIGVEELPHGDEYVHVEDWPEDPTAD